MGVIARGLLGILAALYVLSPGFVRRGAGAALGSLLKVLKLREPVVLDNLSRFEPGESVEIQEKRRRLLRDSYRHLGHLVLEVLALLGPFRRLVHRTVELKGLENWKAASDQGKGVIFLSSHVGDWELMAARGALSGIPLMIVTKKLKPEWLHRAIESARARCGVRCTYEPRTLRDVMGWLKAGNTVGFVLDQYAGPPIGVRVPFFGVPVGTATTVATFARRTGAPVVPVLNYRLPGGKAVVEICPALTWDECEGEVQRALAVNTARYVSVLESHVRAHPEQWLWIHRRFKGDLSPLRPGEWQEGRARG